MRSMVGGVCLAAALIVAGGVEAHGARCAKAEELSAVQTSAIQQELMVAALTCHEIPRFNAFQTGFGPELRIQDAMLARMFKRLYGGRRGEAAYHAFKTKLANDSSMRSIRDNPGYCHEAGSLLAAALEATKPTLLAFVNGASVTLAQPPARACATGVPRIKPKRTARLAASAAQ